MRVRRSILALPIATVLLEAGLLFRISPAGDPLSVLGIGRMGD
jgi:hypothetical protein